MSRKTARDTLFKLVFGYLFNKDVDFSAAITSIETQVTNEDLEYVKSTYEGIVSHEQELNDIIEYNLVGYKLDRVYKLDLCILLVATYELKYTPDVPSSVIINEAVEIAKKYSTDKSPTFVNGLLATIVKEVR